MKNPNITDLDVGQAFKRTFDESDDSIRIKMVEGQQMSLALSADEGDSVQSVPCKKDLAPTGDDCSQLKEISFYFNNPSDSACNFEIQASPDSDGDDFYKINTGTVSALTKAYLKIAICARRVRIEMPAEVAVKMLGQS